MKASIWKDRDSGQWCWLVVGRVNAKAGRCARWEDAVAEVVGGLGTLDEPQGCDRA